MRKEKPQNQLILRGMILMTSNDSIMAKFNQALLSLIFYFESYHSKMSGNTAACLYCSFLLLLIND
ncbi:hypothetical protein BpHYR1_048917 [Brachionus plicatilis]|uniref:Uncharacterized protein n=1 Tax=Brachionus plicatilis TaxID=10195 RepID=A0A3M7PKX6_BRAPC|nr:hypothetical protein BpHYR1_048917 [Brachionus plicatilis]